MSIKPFGAFISESAQLLLEYDQEKTWSQHGKKALDRAEKDSGDNHPALAAVRQHFAAAKRDGIKDPYALQTVDHEGESIVNHHSQNLLAHLEIGDPTPNKKYTQHIVRMYGSGGINRLEDMGRMHKALGKFDDLSKRKIIPAEHRDIGRIKSLGQLEDLVDAHAEKMSGKEEDRAHHEAMKKQSTITDHPEFTHIIPHTEDASKHWGKGTKWCTTSDGAEEAGIDDGGTLFDHYNSEGPLHILVPKKPEYPGQKYQFHYSSHQFMDERDRRVDSSTMHRHHWDPENDDYWGDKAGPAPKPIEDWVDKYNNDARTASKSAELASKHPDKEVYRNFIHTTNDGNAINDYIRRPSNNIDDMHTLLMRNRRNISTDHIDTMLKHSNPEIRSAAIFHPKITSDQWNRMIRDSDEGVRLSAWYRYKRPYGGSPYDHDELRSSVPNHATPESIDYTLSHDPSIKVRAAAVHSDRANTDNITKALQDDHEDVRMAAIKNLNADSNHVMTALNDKDENVALAAVDNKRFRLDTPHIQTLLKRGGRAARDFLVKDSNPGYHALTASKVTSDDLQYALDNHKDDKNLMRAVAMHSSASHNQLHELMDHPDPEVRTTVVHYNKNIDSTHLDKAVKDSSTDVKRQAATHRDLEPHHVDELMKSDDPQIHSHLLSPYHHMDEKLKPEHLKKILSSYTYDISTTPHSRYSKFGDNARAVAGYNNHDESSYNMVATHPDPEVRGAALSSRYTKEHHVMAALNDPNKEVVKKAVAHLSYKNLDAGLDHPDPFVRETTYHTHARNSYFSINAKREHTDKLDRIKDEIDDRNKRRDNFIQTIPKGKTSDRVEALKGWEKKEYGKYFRESSIVPFGEFITELSKELLHKYVNKAKKSIEDMEDGEYSDEKDTKAFKRKAYVSFTQHSRLKEEQIDELKTSTYHNYIRKAKQVVDNTPEDWKEHKKSKIGIARAERLLNKEEAEMNEEKIRHPEDKKAYVEPFKNENGEQCYRASNKHGNVKLFNQHGRRTAFKHAGLLDESVQVDELSSPTLLSYRDAAKKSRDRHQVSAMTWDEIAADKGQKLHDKTPERAKMDMHDRKANNRDKGIELAKTKLRKQHVVPFREHVELVERQLKSSSYLAAVNWRGTKKPEVRHRKNAKMKGMYDWNRTQYVTHQLYRQRNKHDTQHLTSRSKHQLTDRWRDQRIIRVKLLKKSKNLHEDKDYLKNRELLHSAHAQAGREIGKRERDPELKRIHLHRARKHQHAAKVLEIIRNAKSKKKK